MIKLWSQYLDGKCLVIQNNGDGGDSLNRTCVVVSLEALGAKAVPTVLFNVLMSLQDDSNLGRFRRSYHPFKWYSNYNRTSRDQMIPLLIACGLKQYKSTLWNIFLQHSKHLFLLAWNTRRNFQYATLEEHKLRSTPDVVWDYSWKLPDLTGPEFWALYIRGFNIWALYPILVLCDIFTLLGSVVIRYNNDDDVINHALTLEYGRVRLPTPLMALARAMTPRALLQERLDSFFGKPQEPPINEMFSQLP